MTQSASQPLPHAKNPYTFDAYLGLIAIVLLLIGLPYLSLALRAPALFASQRQTYSGLTTEAVIVLINGVIYLAWVLLPAILIGLTKALPQRIAIPTAGMLCVLVSLYLCSDGLVFALFAVHLNPTLLRLCCNPDLIDVLSLSWLDCLVIGLALTALVGLPWGLWWLAQHCRSPRWGYVMPTLVGGWCFCLACSLGMLNRTTAATNNLFSQQLNVYPGAFQTYAAIAPHPSQALLHRFDSNFINAAPHRHHYNDRLLAPTQDPKPRYNLVMIVIDSLRTDAVTPEVMPHLSQFQSTALRFHHHLSGGNATQSGLFSLFYALPPNLWQSMRSTNTPPLLMQRLRALNYRMKILWSNSMRHPDVTHTLYAGLSDLRLDHAPGDDPLIWDQRITEEAVHFLNQPHDQPFFLQLFYHSLHAFCRTDRAAQRFLPTIAQCNQLIPKRHAYRNTWLNRYRNVAVVLDAQIGSLLHRLAQPTTAEHTIVIVTADHAQEFDDNRLGYWGHTSNYSDAQLQVPLLIHWPGKTSQDQLHTTSHYDIAPTLLRHALGVAAPMRAYSIGHDLFDTVPTSYVIAASYTDIAVRSPSSITVLKPSGEVRHFNKQYHDRNAPIDTQAIHFLMEQTLRFLN